jgi:hypothetical protein
MEEYGPGEAPDGVEIFEAIYRPPTPEPAPEARDSPVWDIEEEDQSLAEPPAPDAHDRARLKIGVLPNKGQPTLFKHFESGFVITRFGKGYYHIYHVQIYIDISMHIPLYSI